MTFTEYLEDQCFQGYDGIKDNWESYLERWWEQLDVETVIRYADNYIKQYESGTN